MKLVTAQNLDDGIMMDFKQIRDKLEELYLGNESFIVVSNDDENFIQISRQYFSDCFVIQMRVCHRQQIDCYEKVVFNFNEIEQYFKAYYDNECDLMENLHLWQKVKDLFFDDYNNVQKIDNHQYVKMRLNDDDIINEFNHLQPTKRLILSKETASDYRHLLISLDTITGINQYSLKIKIARKTYHKIINNSEVVRNIVIQFLKNEKINFKDWKISSYVK